VEGITKSRELMASRPGMPSICDFSRVKEFSVSYEALRRLARSPARGEADSVVAIVAPDELIFGVCSMYSALTEKVRSNRHVVRTMEEAYEVLGLTDPEFVPICAR